MIRYKFQSLTGRLKTGFSGFDTPRVIVFQSLTGRLKTRTSSAR